MNVSQSSVFGAPVNVAGYTLRGSRSRSFNAGAAAQKPSTSAEFYNTNFVATPPKRSGNLLQRSSSIIMPYKHMTSHIHISSKRQSVSPAAGGEPSSTKKKTYSFGDKIQDLNKCASFITDKEFNPVKLVSPMNQKVGTIPELSKPGSLLRMPSSTPNMDMRKTPTANFKNNSKSIDRSSLLSNMSE